MYPKLYLKIVEYDTDGNIASNSPNLILMQLVIRKKQEKSRFKCPW